jgi:hypothetical protein
MLLHRCSLSYNLVDMLLSCCISSNEDVDRSQCVLIHLHILFCHMLQDDHVPPSRKLLKRANHSKSWPLELHSKSKDSSMLIEKLSSPGANLSRGNGSVLWNSSLGVVVLAFTGRAQRPW